MKNMKIPSKFSIFPMKNKRPLVSWKEFSTRFPTTEEINNWRNTFGESWAIATGPISKILVLDDDGGLNKTTHPVPNTLTQTTPRGKTHYFFKWTPELEQKVTTGIEILPKVDVRGAGGCVAFYGFDKSPITTVIALPPKWLIDLLPNKQQEPKNGLVTEQPNWLMSELENIQPGAGRQGRTPTFCRVIGLLKAQGLSQDNVLGLLKPWAEKHEYVSHLKELVADQYQRYPVSIVKDDSESLSIDQFLEKHEEVNWIVPGLIAQKSIGFVVGLPGTNKTWAMMDLAIQATKENGLWLGKFPIKQSKVLFVDQERFLGETQRRLKAVRFANSTDTLSPPLQNLFIRCGTTTRIDREDSFNAFKKVLIKDKPDLVIIDSFATFHSKEENNRTEIQQVLERVKSLRQEFGCTFIFIHHENKTAFQKDEESNGPSIAQMAGNIAISAAAEFVFTFRKHDDTSSMVYNTKNTLASPIEPFIVKVTDMNKEKTKIKVEGF